MALRHDRSEAAHSEVARADPTPCAVHVRRADGLEVNVSGSAAFVTPTLERVLTALGVTQPAAPPA